MLTRIISGAVMIVIVAAVLLINSFCPAVTIGFLAVLSAIAVYEGLHNTGIIKNKAVLTGAVVFAAGTLVLYHYLPDMVTAATVLYILFVVGGALGLHRTLSYERITAAIAMPIILCYAFSCIYTVFNTYGLAFLLLVLNFSSVCDCGAYFAGVTLGKHKLCPTISPKKTVEGAVGGIVLSLIATVIIALCFNLKAHLTVLLIFTPVLCVVGMAGDLFASVIKRNVGIKDYGNLIPGHGGILDRFDSILLIAPTFVGLLEIF